jgi:hypothetical protein
MDAKKKMLLGSASLLPLSKFADEALEFHFRVGAGISEGWEIPDVVELVGPDPEDGAG